MGVPRCRRGFCGWPATTPPALRNCFLLRRSLLLRAPSRPPALILATTTSATPPPSAGQPQPQSFCTHSFGNASFNLSPLRRAPGFWTVQDNRNNANSAAYTYFFNVCDNIDLKGACEW